MHNSGKVIYAHVLLLLRLKLRLPNVSPGASLPCPCSAASEQHHWLSPVPPLCFVSCCQLGALCEYSAGNGSVGSDFPSCIRWRTRRGEGLKTDLKYLSCTYNFFSFTSSSLLGSFSWLHGYIAEGSGVVWFCGTLKM